MDRDLVTTFTDELIADEFSRIPDYFREVGTPMPEIKWSPEASDLAEEALWVLLAYWSDMRRGEKLPLASKLDPMDIRPALGYVMVMDVEDDAWDYHYRVYGILIVDRSGFDATGKLISELALHPMEPFFIGSYRACVLTSKYIFARHVPPVRVHTTSWDRLILPLEGEDGTISRLLVGNVPGEWAAHR